MTGSQTPAAAAPAAVSSLLNAPTGLVMIATDGPALVCADGVCAPADQVRTPFGDSALPADTTSTSPDDSTAPSSAG